MVYRSFLIVHAASMGAALLLFVASELLLIPARRGRAGEAKVALLASRFGGYLAMIGILAGIVLYFIGTWPLTPWLMLSLILIALLLLVDHAVLGSWQTKAKALLKGDASRTQVMRIARDPFALLGRVAVLVLFALVAIVMTLKPQLG